MIISTEYNTNNTDTQNTKTHMLHTKGSIYGNQTRADTDTDRGTDTDAGTDVDTAADRHRLGRNRHNLTPVHCQSIIV